MVGGGTELAREASHSRLPHWLLCSIGMQADISLHTKYTELAANAFLERAAAHIDRHQIELFETERGKLFYKGESDDKISKGIRANHGRIQRAGWCNVKATCL